MILGVVVITVGVVGTFTALTGTTAAVIAALFAPTNNLTDHTGASVANNKLPNALGFGFLNGIPIIGPTLGLGLNLGNL